MFIGHFGVAFAAKKISKRGSLGTYIIAAQFLDLLWPMLLIRDIEHVTIEPGNTEFTPLNFVYYPYSHSLVFAIIWSVAFSLFYFLLTKDKKTSVLIAVLVISHWILDWVTHRPDPPLSPWTDLKFGLGLWNNKMATLVVEVIMFIGGAWLYISATSAKNVTGQLSLWVFILFLLGIYFMNAFGHPPDSVHSIAILGLSQLLLVAWGYWIDSNREPEQVRLVPPYGGRRN